MYRKVAITALAGILTLLCGCRRYWTEGMVSRHLRNNQQAFSTLTRDWLTTQSNDFCLFKEGDYRWNGKFIRKSSDGLFRAGANPDIGELLSFDAAAAKAGTTGIQLTHWIDAAQKLDVYCMFRRQVHNSPQPGIEYLEILLNGSANSPYGLRFAPESDRRSLGYLIERSAQVLPPDLVMKPLDGEWFYFESDR